MGLTKSSTGHNATARTNFKQKADDIVIALAGNPNVGKSTVFNYLTGMHQHTGNWPGKTVGSARGRYTYKKKNYILVDIPGAYSLVAHSAEEEVARDFLCFGEADAVVIVCDATCLQRNLNLVLQTLEITSKVVLCLNLMDEAKKKHIHIDARALSGLLGIPVIPTSARNGNGLSDLMEEVRLITEKRDSSPRNIPYRPEIESAVALLEPEVSAVIKTPNPRWLSLKLLTEEDGYKENLRQMLQTVPDASSSLTRAIVAAKNQLSEKGYNAEQLQDAIVEDIFSFSESICRKVIQYRAPDYNRQQLAIDRFLTSRKTGIPVMLLLLLLILWITISGANFLSAWLSSLLFGLQDSLSAICLGIGMPLWLHDPLILGMYRVLAWVVSVMLPPMAIFFPLFSLLEDLGYLPRVAFNLDHSFKKCSACGKQALTMCMGFGCNAVGVIGSRIIDSPRERLIAILTNNFVPCNGRFPTLITIISIFFVTSSTGFFSSLASAVLLTAIIVLGIVMTLISSKLLSKTILKGVPSSFTLELPPYRRPQIGSLIVRSVFDRTLFVLGRAVSVAAPAGLVIYLMTNLTFGDSSLLTHCADMLDPFARLLGLDGVILVAFILGFPANEIVLPIAIMAYLSGSTLTDLPSLETLRILLIDNGWTWLTALCTMIFSLMHWPCSTTLISIKKETGSFKWAAVGFLLPTLLGMMLFFLLTTIVRFIG